MGPGSFGMAKGVSEVGVGLLLFLMGGGEASHRVGEVALVVPPCEAVGVRVVLVFKGSVTGSVEVGIEGVEEVLEGRRGYEGATDDGVDDPISVGICSRGWVMG